MYKYINITNTKIYVCMCIQLSGGSKDAFTLALF